MATKSILKTIHIKDPRAARQLANALEYAAERPAKEVAMSKIVSEASREDIRKMFGIKK